MRVSTKHFHFYSSRDWDLNHGLPKWWRRIIAVGLIARNSVMSDSQYRYCLVLEYQLIPPFWRSLWVKRYE